MSHQPEITDNVSDDYAQAFAGQLLESLQGNPVTVMTDSGPGSHKGSGRYAYSVAPTLNADWFGEIGGKGEKVRKTLKALSTGKMENLPRTKKTGEWKWKETRAIVEALEKAREKGWSATIRGGEPWIGEIPPEHEYKALLSKRLDIPTKERGRLCTDTKGLCRARFAPKKPHRVYLALPEAAYREIQAEASAVHASPNRYLQHVLQQWHEIDAAANREFGEEDEFA